MPPEQRGLVNATGAAVDATFLAVTGDAPAFLATTGSVATTGAILYKPPPLLSLSRISKTLDR